MKKNSGFIFAFVGIFMLMFNFKIQSSFLNSTILIDLFNDTLGYVLIFVGMFMLKKCTKYFRIASVFAIIGFVVSFLTYSVYSAQIAYSVINILVALVNMGLVTSICFALEQAHKMKDNINEKNKIMIKRYMFIGSEIIYSILMVIISFLPESLVLSLILVLFTGISFAVLCLVEFEIIKSVSKLKDVLDEMVEKNKFD